ncbi:MAG TPA: CHASE2 domain-containing protein [Caulobacteraceae bacterium]|nr:CHASE2 domain-containing protein [Caulobacteraceae bacterium]
MRFPPRQTWSGKIFGIDLADLIAERRRAGLSFTVGLIVLLLIQIPAIEQSFLGGPDRQMMETAFKLRADVIRGSADPVLFLDIDDRSLSQLQAGAPPFSPPLATAPRAAIADLLEFIRTAPAGSAPHAVILDVDLSQPASDGQPGVERLRSVLTAWAASGAPPLIIAREPYPPSAFGANGAVPVLPDTPYEAIVTPAPNIFWASARVLADQNAVVREFLPYECVSTSRGTKPRYSASLLAYRLMEPDHAALARAPAMRWLTQGDSRCRTNPGPPLRRGERIDYHLSMDLGFAARVWPNVSSAWPGLQSCERPDTAVLRRLSVIDILDAVRSGADVDRGILCRHVVIIGGTNASAGDFIQTPLNEMNGSIVLANAVRGLQLTHGGMRPIPLLLQILLLLFVSAWISLSAAATARARRRYTRLRQSASERSLARRLMVIPLNPILLNAAIALLAHWFGIALLMVSLNFGLWGFLSAPVAAAAITETVQAFNES